MEEAFGREHERTYGHRAGPEEPVELTEIRLIGQGISQRPLRPGALKLSSKEKESAPFSSDEQPLPPRRAYFGAEVGWLDTPVLRRGDLGAVRDGPCIVEEYDATCVIPPGACAELDDFGNILIRL
jgi:N-methylhydantoinase A